MDFSCSNYLPLTWWGLCKICKKLSFVNYPFSPVHSSLKFYCALILNYLPKCLKELIVLAFFTISWFIYFSLLSHPSPEAFYFATRLHSKTLKKVVYTGTKLSILDCYSCNKTLFSRV